MRIILNNTPLNLPDDFMTIEQLLQWKNINPAGTAVAINNKIIKKDIWDTVKFENNDSVTIISAAYGG